MSELGVKQPQTNSWLYYHRLYLTQEGVELLLHHQETEIKKLKVELAEIKSQKKPCSPTCYHHQTHPCENCGRISGYLPVVLKHQRIQHLEAEIEKLKSEHS